MRLVSLCRKVLVPLDGSSRSERSIPWARRMATDPDLILARVIERGRLLKSEVAPAPTDLFSDGERALYRASVDFRGRPAIIVRVGSLVPTLLDIARDENAEMIVLSSHGNSPVTQWVPGGTTMRLARESDIPVLVVPSWKEPPSLPTVKKILISWGDRKAPSQAQAWTYRLEVAFGCRSAGPLPSLVRERDPSHRARRRSIFPSRFVPDAILGAAEQEAADLILWGSTSRHGSNRTLFQLLRSSPIPILVIPAKSVRRETAVPASPGAEK